MTLVAQNIRNLKPYQPGKPIEELERELGIVGAIKLASNENPIGTSPRAVEAIRAAAHLSHIYPDPGTFRLRAALSEYHRVEPDEIAIGNGSAELISLITRAFCTPDDTAVISQYAFVAYRVVLQASDIAWTEVATGAGFTQDLSAMAAACDDRTKVVFVANPNNPTGVYNARAELEQFLRAVPAHVVVVLDEAYVEYALADDYVSALELREAREHLIVCRTFSKCLGLAGLRIGYAVGPAELIGFINRIREPFNAGMLGQVAAVAALSDGEHKAQSVAVNEESRAITEAGFAALGLEYIPSQTNFLLVQTPRPGIEIYDAMLRLGVIVRPLVPYGLRDWLRISLGTPAQMTRCIDALGQAIG